MSSFLQSNKGVLTGVAVGMALGLMVKSCAKKAEKKVVKKAEFKNLLEYSVVYTDRALNLFSAEFAVVMKDINLVLREAYSADKAIIIPGSGTFGMEAVARQFAEGQDVMVLRNGYFSFRWTDIFEVTGCVKSHKVMKANCPAADRKSTTPQFSPCDLKTVIQSIKTNKPKVVFAPHVETSVGMIISDEYIKAVADAVHSVGGLLVIDAIAAGTVFCDMKKCDVDVVISAPQKGWSGPACCAFVMLSDRAAKEMKNTKSKSFSTNLAKWDGIMDNFLTGGKGKYYTTLPTDALRTARDAMLETKAYGFAKATTDAWTLGNRVRKSLASRGYHSVAAPDVAAPGVIVVYAKNQDTKMVPKFAGQGIQVAGGVPFKLGEPEGLVTFRIGLFGLDKLGNIDRTVTLLEQAVDKIDASN